MNKLKTNGREIIMVKENLKLYIMLLIAVCGCLVGCGTNKAEAVVKNYFESMKNSDVDEMKTLIKNTKDTKNNALTDVMLLYAQEYHTNIEYTIEGSIIDEDTATIDVEVKYSNLGPIVKLALIDLVNNSISSAFMGVELDDDDMDALFGSYFEKHKEDVSVLPKTETLKVECEKIDGKWKIIYSDELINVYFCNMMNALDSFESDNSEKTSEIEDTQDIEPAKEVPEEQISDQLTYGTYILDNGVNAVCTAEVGFTTDESSCDYINISAMGYDGHEVASFYGDIALNQEGNYEAYCEYLNTTIVIRFDEIGMNINILSCDDSYMMESIVGKYLLTSELNLNEVG